MRMTVLKDVPPLPHLLLYIITMKQILCFRWDPNTRRKLDAKCTHNHLHAIAVPAP